MKSARKDPLTLEKTHKMMGILAYIMFLIPLLAARDSKFAMYHANQGLLLFITAVLTQAVATFTPLYWTELEIAFSLCAFALAVIGIINASKGRMKPLPLIGGFNLLQ